MPVRTQGNVTWTQVRSSSSRLSATQVSLVIKVRSLRHQLVAALVCLVDVLTLLLFVRLCRHYVLKAVLLELLYDDRPC